MLDEVLVDGAAAFAAARIAAVEEVSRPAMNLLLGRLVDLHVPADTFAWVEDPDERRDAEVNLKYLLNAAIREGELDWRILAGEPGWTTPRIPGGGFLARLVTCPVCLSFHTAWVLLALTGRFRPWRPSSWVRLLATWAIASTAARLPFNTSAAVFGPGTLVSQALAQARAAAEARR